MNCGCPERAQKLLELAAAHGWQLPPAVRAFLEHKAAQAKPRQQAVVK